MISVALSYHVSFTTLDKMVKRSNKILFQRHECNSYKKSISTGQIQAKLYPNIINLENALVCFWAATFQKIKRIQNLQ